MYTGLGDLDEMILRCQNIEAREYLREAVLSYKSGAYRSAIIATWIAVNFDLISKLRSLSLAGNSEAGEWVQKYERIRGNYDPENYKSAKPALEFERELIERVTSADIELLSAVELYDLKRLRQDRHRCAHPTMQNAEERFNPTAELARYHLRNAVDYVLARPAFQGRFAVTRYLSVVRDAGFPLDAEGALQVLKESELASLSDSTLKSIAHELAKLGLGDRLTLFGSLRLPALLSTMRIMYPRRFEEYFTIAINQTIDDRVPDILARLIRLMKAAPWVWSALAFKNQQQVRRVASNLAMLDGTPAEWFWLLFSVPSLVDVANSKLKQLSLSSFLGARDKLPTPHLLDETMRRLSESKSVGDTYSIIDRVLEPNLASLDQAQIASALSSYCTNLEVRESWKATPFLIALLNERVETFVANEREWRGVLQLVEASGRTKNPDLAVAIRVHLLDSRTPPGNEGDGESQ